MILDMLAHGAWCVELDAGRLDEANRGAAALLETAIGAGLGYARAADGQRLFDPAEVDQFVEWAAAVGIDHLWPKQRAINGAGMLAEARASRFDPAWTLEGSRNFSLTSSSKTAERTKAQNQRRADICSGFIKIVG